jgi:hypothetical protein
MLIVMEENKGIDPSILVTILTPPSKFEEPEEQGDGTEFFWGIPIPFKKEEE